MSALRLSTEPNRTEVCAKHGEFESRHIFGKIWTRCAHCAAAEQSEEEERRAEQVRMRRQVELYQRVGAACIPERFRDRRLETFRAETDEQKAALAFAKAFAADFDSIMTTGRSALLIGRPGTGKTHLSVGIAHAVMDEGYTALFTTTIRALRRVKDTWSRGAQETESQAVAALTAPDLLILDEVGIQFGSETEKQILFDVLNERYEKRRPTLYLSNLTVPEVRTFLGERIFDRIREDGGKVVTFDWSSHRGKQA
ncbi:MAG: ATP-binding protein [Rhodocyclaceae bacterium]|nr:ATP-binding protein [Rhodocyclaceae bacterium]